MASYMLHRGKRYRVSRKFDTKAKAETHGDKMASRNPLKGLMLRGAKVHIATIRIDAGKDKGKYAVAWYVTK